MTNKLAATGRVLALAALITGSAHAQPIIFQDIADPAHGITYSRTPSAIVANADALRAKGKMGLYDLALAYPLKSMGAPGVALLDYDNDGDLDIYVTNGPGRQQPCSNQLAEGDHLRRRPRRAGAGALKQDRTGVCDGDTDNDGD